LKKKRNVGLKGRIGKWGATQERELQYRREVDQTLLSQNIVKRAFACKKNTVETWTPIPEAFYVVSNPNE